MGGGERNRTHGTREWKGSKGQVKAWRVLGEKAGKEDQSKQSMKIL